MTGKTRNSMAAIMTILVTVVMWMTAAIGAIVLLAGSIELVSMLSGSPISIGAITVDDHDISVPELAAGLVGVLVVVCAVVFVSLELRKILQRSPQVTRSCRKTLRASPASPSPSRSPS